MFRWADLKLRSGALPFISVFRQLFFCLSFAISLCPSSPQQQRKQWSASGKSEIIDKSRIRWFSQWLLTVTPFTIHLRYSVLCFDHHISGHRLSKSFLCIRTGVGVSPERVLAFGRNEQVLLVFVVKRVDLTESDRHRFNCIIQRCYVALFNKTISKQNHPRNWRRGSRR